jgi:hypothetical protein
MIGNVAACRNSLTREKLVETLGFRGGVAEVADVATLRVSGECRSQRSTRLIYRFLPSAGMLIPVWPVPTAIPETRLVTRHAIAKRTPGSTGNAEVQECWACTLHATATLWAGLIVGCF